MIKTLIEEGSANSYEKQRDSAISMLWPGFGSSSVLFREVGWQLEVAKNLDYIGNREKCYIKSLNCLSGKN